MTKVAVVGTDLAPLHAAAGALERLAIGWAGSARRLDPRLEVFLVDGRGGPDAVAEAIATGGAALAVVNNRPLWAEAVGVPVLHVLHNYPDAWGADGADPERLGAALRRGVVSAVSPALAAHVQSAFGLGDPVRVVSAGVEEVFFAERWRGEGGAVLFPNRLLEKKGVRLFLEVARRLAPAGRRCVMFRHLAPFEEPSAEQQELLSLVAGAPSVELVEPAGSRAAMARRYAEAAVVLCPSIRPEGLGMVALEAEAVGAPVVTSGLGGLADATFEPNETVGDGDPDAWCDAVERALARPASVLPAMAVRRAHGEEVAARSFLALVRQASGRGYSAHEHGVYSRP